MEEIGKRINRLKQDINRTKEKFNINKDIKIVAVSKTFNSACIHNAFKNGMKFIGENRYKEAKSKIDKLKDLNIVWHFVGKVQSNKIRKVMNNFDLVQSVSKAKYIKKINEIAETRNICYPFFLEVNIGREPNKSGFLKEELEDVFELLHSKKNIKLKGLMCIPPYTDVPEDRRKYFTWMKDIFEDYKKYNNGESIQLTELSMGMTEDYNIAIQEGSTMIRVGRKIFGKRYH